MSKSTFSNRFISLWAGTNALESLAVGRVILGTIQFYRSLNFLQKLLDLSKFPKSLYSPILFLECFTFGHHFNFSSKALFCLLSLVLILSGLGSILGYQTKFSLFVFFLIQAFLVSFSYSFGDYHHDQAVPILAGFLLCLTPSGNMLSIDSSVRQSTYVQHGWFFEFIKYYLGIVYFLAGSTKLLHSGEDWITGKALAYYVSQDALANSKELGLWLSQQPVLCRFLSWVTLSFQTSFLFFIRSPRFQTTFALLGILFHVSTDLVMKANFPGFIGVLCFLLPWKTVIRTKQAD